MTHVLCLVEQVIFGDARSSQKSPTLLPRQSVALCLCRGGGERDRNSGSGRGGDYYGEQRR